MKPIQIEGCEHYSVSEYGVVLNTRTGKVLKPDLTSGGYRRVTLWNGNYNRVTVHRLVAIHFIENPEQYPIVNHIDGNKLNNHFSNLEWCTVSHNTRHALETGLRTLDFQYKGPAFNRTLSADQVRKVRRMKDAGIPRRRVLEEVGCSVDQYKKIDMYYRYLINMVASEGSTTSRKA